MIPISQILLAAPTDFGTVEGNFLPLVFLALLADAGIVSIWYFAGVILNNKTIKQGAISEYYQFLGTALIAVLLIWGITTYSSLATTVYGSTTLMSPSAISTLCTNLQSQSPIDVIGSGSSGGVGGMGATGGSLLAGYTNAGGKSVSGICSMISSSGTPATLTDAVNYPLLASTVIIANLTNQSVSDLNSAYVFDAYMGFLSTLSPTIGLCFSSPPPAIACLVPIPGDEYIRADLRWTPYSGYNIIYDNLDSLGILLNLSTEAFVAQLLILTIILFAWPYLLFGGLLLRSTFLTRRLGGLLLAIVIGSVIIFPTVLSIEYLTLAKGISAPIPIVPLAPSSINTTYGFNSLTGIPQGTGTLIPTVSGTVTYYNVNFFVLPNLKQAITAYGCWPQVGITGVGSANIGLAGAEFADMLYLLIPGVNVESGIEQIVAATFGSSTPEFQLPASCPPQGAIATFNALVNAYGIIGVSSYFIPIINLIITLTTIIGMSKLLGGDTKLEGLSRFL